MKLLKLILPLLVLGAAVYFGKYLIATGPKAKKKPFVQRLPVVEVVTLKTQNYTVKLKASGIVRAGTQTNIVSEISGRIINISDIFNEGSYFKNNQTLLTIDSENYKNALAITSSEVAGNRATLSQLGEEEKSTKRSYHLAKKNLNFGQREVIRKRKLLKQKLIARSVVDVEEQKLNQLQQRLEETQGRLNAFKSRKLAIQAKISAALSRQKQERLNITRTTIKTPYAGRVLQKKVDIGQFVAKGANLGTIYATEFVYIDLPLSLNQYELLGIPESFQNKAADSNRYPKVIFNSINSRQQSHWQGRIVRTSAALDADSRQIKVIARIDKPFEEKSGVTAPVRIGQYLDAIIEGKTFRNVYVISSAAVRQNKELMLLKGGKVHLVPVDVLFNTSKETIIKTKEDISGQQIIITSMNQATEGMQVITLEQQRNNDKEKEQRKKQKKKNNEKTPSKQSNG